MSTNVNPAFSIIGGAGGQKLFLDGELYEGKAGKPKLSITTEIVPVLLGRQPYKFDSSSSYSSFSVLNTGKPVICNGQIIVYSTSSKDIFRFDGWDFRSISSLFSPSTDWKLYSNLISSNNFIYCICFNSYYSNKKTYLYKMSPITGNWSSVFTFPDNSYNEYTKICIIGDNMHIFSRSTHQVLNLNTLELTNIGNLPFSVSSYTDIEVIGDVIYILVSSSDLYMYKDSVLTRIISNNNALRLSGNLKLYQHEGKLRSWSTPPLITNDKSDKVDITYLYELNDDSFIIVDTLPFLLLNRDPKTNNNNIQGYLFEDKGILYYLGNISYTELRKSSDANTYQEVSLATGLFKLKRDVTGLEVI